MAVMFFFGTDAILSLFRSVAHCIERKELCKDEISTGCGPGMHCLCVYTSE